AVTVLVVIDTPRALGRTGGVVAAPVSRRISEVVLRQLAVPRNLDPEPPVLIARRPEAPVTPVRYGSAQVVPTAPAVPARDGRMPAPSGRAARAASRQLARIGLSARVTGVGVVADQHPAPGTPVEPGTSVRLELDRRPLQMAQGEAALP